MIAIEVSSVIEKRNAFILSMNFLVNGSFSEESSRHLVQDRQSLSFPDDMPDVHLAGIILAERKLNGLNSLSSDKKAPVGQIILHQNRG